MRSRQESTPKSRAYYRKAALTQSSDACCARHRVAETTAGRRAVGRQPLRRRHSDRGSRECRQPLDGVWQPLCHGRSSSRRACPRPWVGGGLDVILSAKRVGQAGKAFGVDFLPEMVELAQANAREAGVTNVEFREGMIEDLPLADDSVDVVISNCVINLAPDKVPVFDELSRVLRPGGRVAISDVVADNGVEPSDDAGEWADCGAGALPIRRVSCSARSGWFEQALDRLHPRDRPWPPWRHHQGGPPRSVVGRHAAEAPAVGGRSVDTGRAQQPRVAVMEERLYFRQLLSGRDFATDNMIARQMVNFSYLIGDRETGEAVVVDPAYDVADLVRVLDEDDMRLVGVLGTHYHADHIGGNMMGHQVTGIAELLELGEVPFISSRPRSNTSPRRPASGPTS